MWVISNQGEYQVMQFELAIAYDELSRISPEAGFMVDVSSACRSGTSLLWSHPLSLLYSLARSPDPFLFRL